MSNRETKENKKMHYLKIIFKHEPIHPHELKTKHNIKRVRYDYIEELCGEQKIEREKYEEKYVLLFMPGHKYKADNRYNQDFPNRKRFDFYQKQELQFDFTELIEYWLKKLPHIAMMYGVIIDDDNDYDTPYTGIGIEGHPLYDNFKSHVMKLINEHPDLFLNPFSEQNKFDNNVKSFNKLRKELINEILKIFPLEIGVKTNICNETYDLEVPIEFIQGILARLNFGVREIINFSKQWLDNFVFIDSHIEESEGFYKYYLRNLMNNNYFSFLFSDKLKGFEDSSKDYFLLKLISVDDQIKEKFQNEMDEKIKEMLRQIGESEKIREKTITLNNLQNESYKILNKIKDNLEKIKAIK